MLEKLVCEGGQSGEEVFELANKINEAFFKLGLDVLAFECNKRREIFLDRWRERSREDRISDDALSEFTYQTGVTELSPSFELLQPERILTHIVATLYSTNANVPALVYSSPERQTIKYLYIFLPALEKLEGIYYWSWARMLFEDVVVHELLHTCGEVQYNGIIRYNFIGVNTIKPLLNLG